MKTKDLKSYLELLKKNLPDELVVVDKKVNSKFELPAVIAKLASLNRYPAVLFNHVSGHDMTVVSNLFADHKRIALALECDEKDLHAVYRAREDNKIGPELVKSGPVKQVIQTKGNIDLTQFPVIAHNEKDAGPYITAGAMVIKDPETGIRNIGMYRHRLHNKKRMGIHLAETSHSSLIYEKYIRLGKPMEVAITVGMHPAFYLGVLSFVPFGVDEYTVVGGLMKEPLKLVKCETVDLEVPAMAEIVIEGKIDPQARKADGPFGEYTSVYGKQVMNPVIDVTAVTMRKNPIYLDILSGHIDHQLVGGIPRLSSIYKAVWMACPTVKDVFMPPSGYCRFICYISIEKRHEGEAKNAACAAFAADPFIKYVVVVDSDIDIFDDSSVCRAIAGRVRADEDVFLIKNAKGHPLDPTARDGFLVGKVGIDATKPLKGYPETVTVPGFEDIDLGKYLQ
ncbi:MAG: UbiD family decarboxylase [Chloroflexota bacterium]